MSTSSTPDGPPTGPPGFWDAVFLRKPSDEPLELVPIAEDPPVEDHPGYLIPRNLNPVLMLAPGDVIDVRLRGHNLTRYRVVSRDGDTITVEPLDTPRPDPQCGALSPTGVRRCLLNPGHHGRHGHAPEGTADWTTWESTP